MILFDTQNHRTGRTKHHPTCGEDGGYMLGQHEVLTVTVTMICGDVVGEVLIIQHFSILFPQPYPNNPDYMALHPHHADIFPP